MNLRDIKTRDVSGVGAIFGIDDLLIAAAISAAGSAIGGASSAKAAKTATNAASDSAAQNIALSRETYNRNTANLNPFLQTGYAANGAIGELLGLTAPRAAGGTNPLAGGAPVTTGGGPDWDAYLAANPDIGSVYSAGAGSPDFLQKGLTTPQAYAQYQYQNYGQAEGRQLPTAPVSTMGGAYGETATADPAPAKTAFQNYLDSTGHKFQLQTGSDAISTNAVTNGMLRSGATLKGLTKYGQDLGAGSFQTYLANLAAQQGVGLSAGNALAGVGNTMVGQVTAANDSAASTKANAALLGASNTNALLGTLGSAFGTYAGLSSYRPQAAAPAPPTAYPTLPMMPNGAPLNYQGLY